MTISFECECGKRLSAKPEAAGKTGECPNCGQQVTVPAPKEMADIVNFYEDPAAPDSRETEPEPSDPNLTVPNSPAPAALAEQLGVESAAEPWRAVSVAPESVAQAMPDAETSEEPSVTGPHSLDESGMFAEREANTPSGLPDPLLLIADEPADLEATAQKSAETAREETQALVGMKVSLRRWEQEFQNWQDVEDALPHKIEELQQRLAAAEISASAELNSLQFSREKFGEWVQESRQNSPNIFLAPLLKAASAIAKRFVDEGHLHDGFWTANVFGEICKIPLQTHHEKYGPFFERLLASACSAVSNQKLPSHDNIGEPDLTKLRANLENIAQFACGTFYHTGKKVYFRQQRPDTVMQSRVVDDTTAAHFDAHLRYLLNFARPRVKEYVTSNMPVVYRLKLPDSWTAKRKEWEQLICEAGFEDDLNLLKDLGDLVIAEEVGEVPPAQRERMKFAAQNNDYKAVIAQLQKSAKEIRRYLYTEAQRRLILRSPPWPRVEQKHASRYTQCRKAASSDDSAKLQKALAILQDIWQADIQNYELRDLVAYLEARTGNIAAAEQKLQQISRRRDALKNFATDWNLAVLAYDRGDEKDAYELLGPLLSQHAADEDLVVIVLALSLKLNDYAMFLETIPKTMGRRFHPLAIVVASERGDEARLKDLWGELVNQWDRNTEELPPVQQRFSPDEFQKIVNRAIVNGQVDQLVAWLDARIKTQGNWVPNYLQLARVYETECEEIDKAFAVLEKRCESLARYRKDDRQKRLDEAYRDLFELCKRTGRKDLGEKAYRVSEGASISTNLLDSFKTFAPDKRRPPQPEPAPVPPLQPDPRPSGGIFQDPTDAERFTWIAARLSDVRDVESYVASGKAIEGFIAIVSRLSPEGGGTVVQLIKNVSEAIAAFSRTSKDHHDARLHLYEKAVEYEKRLRELIGSGALEQVLGDVLTPYCKSLEQTVGDLTRQAGIGPSLDVTVENAFYSAQAVSSTLVLRIKNTSDRPVTDVWVDALFDAPQLMPVGSRECRIKRLESQRSTLFAMKLRRNRDVSADDFHEFMLRVSLKASAEGHPNIDLGIRRLEVPIRSLQDVIGEDSIPRLFIVGKPLTPSDQALFQGRDDIMSKFKSSFYGGMQRERYFLDGIRRAGKTSILNFLPNELPEKAFPVLVNLDRFDLRPPINSPAVLKRLCQEIANAVPHINQPEIGIPEADDWESSPAQAFEHFLIQFNRAFPDRVPCLMFDEFQEILWAIARSAGGKEQDTLVLDQLRGHMDEGRIYAIFTGSVRFDRLARIMEHRIFGSLTRLRVSFLSEEGVANVLHAGLREWVTVAPEAIRRIFRLTGGYPWLVQTYGTELVDLLNQEERTFATPDDVDRITKEAVLCNDELFSFWWPIEQLGSSEERFIELLLRRYPDPSETVYVRDFFNELPNREQPAFKRAFENLRACEVLDSTQTEELHFRGSVLREWLQSQINDDGQLRIRNDAPQAKVVDRGQAGIFIDHENLIHSLVGISERRGIPVPVDDKLKWFRPILAQLIDEAERRVGQLTYKVTVAFWTRAHEASLLTAYFEHGFIPQQPEKVKVENAVDFKVADEIRRANEQALKQGTRLSSVVLICGDGDLSHAARSFVNDRINVQIWGGVGRTSGSYESIVGERNVIALDDICGL